MAILRRNIWTLFIILLAGGFFFLGVISYHKWYDLNEEHRIAQINLVQLISSTMTSLFATQEMMLDILGRELMNDDSYKTVVKSPEILNHILALNPAIVSFGLATPEGKLTFVSGNANPSMLPNLKEQEASRNSFILALESDKMVLGRSYFYKAANSWVIPIRKSIRDKEGNILAVMTAGLRMDGPSKILSDGLRAGDFEIITLVRDQDHFIQFQSSTNQDLNTIYNTSIPQVVFDRIAFALNQKYHQPLSTLKEREEIYTFEVINAENKMVNVAAKYNPRYEIWTFSHLEKSHVFSQFILDFLIFSSVFVIVQMILYLLFRYIANAENHQRQELIFQATHDTLTSLPNRNYLQNTIHEWIYENSPPFSLFYIDMDNFKNVNDSFGHEFGDNVLMELSKRLKFMMQDDSIVIRQGGDEFLILSTCTNDQELLAYAQRIINKASQPYRIHELSFVIGASIGIAKYPEHGTTLDMLLRAADIAMYESKKYKNSAHIFVNEMQTGYLDKVFIEQELRKALDKELLYMVYQPQVNNKGETYGVEALVRWEDENLGFMPPDQFIPIAEASGLMPRLGKFILSSSLRQMQKFQKTTGKNLQISINISVRQFMESNFLENLKEEIDKVNLPKESITLEITENLLIEDIGRVLPLLDKIHAMGIHISMDDFGTGYSSLSMLRLLPIDELKIDKSFVDTILHDETARKMIQNIISIGKNLDMSILAEGVETKEQENILKSFGCDLFQGYFYAKPMPYDKLLDFCTAN